MGLFLVPSALWYFGVCNTLLLSICCFRRKSLSTSPDIKAKGYMAIAKYETWKVNWFDF
jgi:hypothetical protein